MNVPLLMSRLRYWSFPPVRSSEIPKMCLSLSEADGKCFIELRKIDWCMAVMTAITERKSAMKKAAEASHGARLKFCVFARIATVAEMTEA